MRTNNATIENATTEATEATATEATATEATLENATITPTRARRVAEVISSAPVSILPVREDVLVVEVPLETPVASAMAVTRLGATEASAVPCTVSKIVFRHSFRRSFGAEALKKTEGATLEVAQVNFELRGVRNNSTTEETLFEGHLTFGTKDQDIATTTSFDALIVHRDGRNWLTTKSTAADNRQGKSATATRSFWNPTEESVQLKQLVSDLIVNASDYQGTEVGEGLKKIISAIPEDGTSIAAKERKAQDKVNELASKLAGGSGTDPFNTEAE